MEVALILLGVLSIMAGSSVALGWIAWTERKRRRALEEELRSVQLGELLARAAWKETANDNIRLRSGEVVRSKN